MIKRGTKMKKRILCFFGFHIWYDAMHTKNYDGSFSIQNCMKCNNIKVYKEYSLNGYTRLHLLEDKEIPKSVLEGLKDIFPRFAITK